MKILNLCAGDRPIESYGGNPPDYFNVINTDIVKIRPDYVFWNINKKSSFKNNEFNLIIADSAINYVKDGNTFISLIHELYRIAKPKAIIKIMASTTNSKRSMLLQPFKLHMNDIENCFTRDGWYKDRYKPRFIILKKRWNKILPRWATVVYYELQVIK